MRTRGVPVLNDSLVRSANYRNFEAGQTLRGCDAKPFDQPSREMRLIRKAARRSRVCQVLRLLERFDRLLQLKPLEQLRSRHPKIAHSNLSQARGR